jgi:hypothetical protein
MSDFQDDFGQDPEAAPQGGGGFLKYCLICGCLVALAAMLLGGIAIWKLKGMFILDPVAVEANLKDTIECEVPTGYAGMFGMNMAGVQMSMIAPSGTMKGNTSQVPLMIVAMKLPPGADSAQAKRQMQQQMNQGGMGGGSMSVESEDQITISIRGNDVQAQSSVGNQNGQKMKQVVLMIDRSSSDPTQVMLMFMGQAGAFDQAAMDSFLQSIK